MNSTNTEQFSPHKKKNINDRIIQEIMKKSRHEAKLLEKSEFSRKKMSQNNSIIQKNHDNNKRRHSKSELSFLFLAEVNDNEY